MIFYYKICFSYSILENAIHKGCELFLSRKVINLNVCIFKWACTPFLHVGSKFKWFQVICAVKALRNLGVKEIRLFIPYLLGARSDRQFVEGGTSYLRDVIAPILNSLELESIACLDVHSDVAAACIKNLKVIENNALVASFIISLANARNIVPTSFLENCVFISPDTGCW